MLSKGAFNALLKIMEEPPVYICFILATTEIPKVPETIVSRCQVFHFKKLHVKEITTRLELICQQEKLSYEIEALELISKLAE
jgi:DNA polymerase-3 subunit gamma/tau